MISLAKVLLFAAAPFVAADRLCQSAVDALAFALMRRGLSKGAIRFGVASVMVLAGVVDIAATWRYEAKHPVMTTIDIACLVWISVWNHIQSIDDALADSGGMQSPHDERHAADTSWKVIIAVSLVRDVLASPSKEMMAALNGQQLAIHRAFNVGFWFLLLFLFYLKGTPRTPPPAKSSAASLLPVEAST